MRLKSLDPVVLLRIMVGSVFLSEGIQKFLFPGELGVGRFVRIGIPWPAGMAPFVGAVEGVAGALTILGVLLPYAVTALWIDISVALISTKLPILLGEPIGPFTLSHLPRYGFLAALHEARVDWCMFLGCIALLASWARSRSPLPRGR